MLCKSACRCFRDTTAARDYTAGGGAYGSCGAAGGCEVAGNLSLPCMRRWCVSLVVLVVLGVVVE